MPIYEYECPVCGRFELVEKATAKPATSCPQCAEQGKKNKVTRVISASAFHLKGSGWYKTDYTSSNKNVSKKNKETKTESTSEGSASDSKSSSDESGGSKEKSSLNVAGGCGGNCSCH